MEDLNISNKDVFSNGYKYKGSSGAVKSLALGQNIYRSDFKINTSPDDFCYLILYILIAHRGKMDNDDLEMKLLWILKERGIHLDISHIRRFLGALRDKGYIEVEKNYSDEYLKCLEEAKKNKRVKNPRSYCGKQHPSPNRILITSRGFEHYIQKHIELYTQLNKDNLYCYKSTYEYLCNKVNHDRGKCKDMAEKLALCKLFKSYRERYPQICVEAERWAEELKKEYTNIKLASSPP